MFITNLVDPAIQRELLKQTLEPRQALELAINMELGMRNQYRIQQHNKTLIPASVNAIQFPSNSRSANWSLSTNIHKQCNRPPLYCLDLGGNWLLNHRDKCIGKGKTVNNFSLLNHFAKVFRRQKKSKPQKSQEKNLNTVDEEPHPEDSVNFLQSSKLNYSDNSSGENNMVTLIQNDFAKIEPLNMPIKIGNI